MGATLTGAAFVLPSSLMVMALAAVCLHYGQLAWIQGVFYGVGAAAIAIIARSAYKLVRSTVKSDWLLWVFFIALALTWMMRIIIANWKTFPYRKRYTAWQSTRKRTGYTRRSRKWMEKQRREWRCTKRT